MNWLKICCVCLLIAIVSACAPTAPPATPPVPSVAPTTPAAMPTPTPVLIPTQAVLTPEGLRNMEYDLPVSQKRVRLTDGKYQSGSGSDIHSVGMAEPIGLGDLNGDGLDDAVVVLGENMGGSGTFESLVVVVNRDGVPVQSGSVELGDRVGINAITIQNLRVTVDQTVHGPQDPFCCPTVPVSETFRLTGSDLVVDRVTSKTPLGQERAITIESPQYGTLVSSPVGVTGSETIAPFENNLVFRVYDEGRRQLSEGYITVTAAEPGGPATFETVIDVSAVPSGQAFWLEILDISAADGSTLALAAVQLSRQ